MSKGTRKVTGSERRAIQHAENMVAKAAKAALRYMIEKGNPAYGFVTLEGEDRQAAGMVIVCMDPSKVGALIEFIASGGNFSTKTVPE